MDERQFPLDTDGLENLKEKALDAFNIGQFDKATRMLNKILRIDSCDFSTYHLLANIAFINGDYQRSQDYLFQSKALPDLTMEDHSCIDQNILENTAEELISKIKTYAKSGNYEVIEANLKEILRIYPEHEEANIYYAVLLTDEGNYEQAIDRLLKLLQRNNLESCESIQLLLSNFYKEIYDFENSYLYLDMVAKNCEKINDPYLYYRLAEQSFRNGNYSKSADYLDHYEKLVLEEEDNREAILKIIIARIGFLKAKKNIKQILLDGRKYLEDIKNGKKHLDISIGVEYADTFYEKSDVNSLLDFIEMLQNEKLEENELMNLEHLYFGYVEEIRGNYPKSLYHFQEMKKCIKNYCIKEETDFTEMWQEFSEVQEYPNDFETHIDESPFAIFVDEKIEKYSK